MTHSEPSTRASLTLVICGLLSACAAPAPARAPAEFTEIVIGIEYRLASEVLGQTRAISICLPSGYAERDAAFPVVYLIDGGVQQDLVPVAGFGALATLSAQYREFILVGIETQDRRFELTTPSTEPYDLLQIPHNGGAAEFRRFIVEELQPWVEQRYRTTGETAVLGESLAGFFIVDTFLRAPASFDHYIAISPSLWWEQHALASSAASRLEARVGPAARSLFLSAADEADIRAGLEPLVAALEAHAPPGLTWWFKPRPDEHHNTIYHPATLEALRLILGEPDRR